jgi:hypothetical protein
MSHSLKGKKGFGAFTVYRRHLISLGNVCDTSKQCHFSLEKKINLTINNNNNSNSNSNSNSNNNNSSNSNKSNPSVEK